MSEDSSAVKPQEIAHILVTKDGPLEVRGSVPVTRTAIGRDEDGNAVRWLVTETFDAEETQWLCRCGQSGNKPFCDGSHKRGFSARDSAPEAYDEAAVEVQAGDPIIRDDRSLCVHAQFCFSRTASQKFSVWKPTGDPSQPEVRQRLEQMVNHCPSGALTMVTNTEDRESVSEPAIGVVEHGPYAVTGGIPISLADGTVLEARDRVALCRCGQSATKPLCDGSHDKAAFRDPA